MFVTSVEIPLSNLDIVSVIKEDTMNLSVSFHSNVTNVHPHLPRSGIWICMI